MSRQNNKNISHVNFALPKEDFQLANRDYAKERLTNIQ